MKVHQVDSALSGVQAAGGPRAAGAEGARQTGEASPPSAIEGGTGAVRLSSRAAELARVKELALAQPELRPDVVAQARADLAAGRLEADPHSLAMKIAADLF